MDKADRQSHNCWFAFKILKIETVSSRLELEPILLIYVEASQPPGRPVLMMMSELTTRLTSLTSDSIERKAVRTSGLHEFDRKWVWLFLRIVFLFVPCLFSSSDWFTIYLPQSSPVQSYCVASFQIVTGRFWFYFYNFCILLRPLVSLEKE